jgi:uncharacterized membrane protein
MDVAKAAQRALGGMLVFAGISHLTFARRDFRAQVPDWVPLGKDGTVLASGVAEIALGASLVPRPGCAFRIFAAPKGCRGSPARHALFKSQP